MASSRTPEEILESALAADSVTQLRAALDNVRSTSPSSYDDYANSALRDAVRHGAVACLMHILDEESVWVHKVSIFDLIAKPSVALFEALLDYYDFDREEVPNSLFQGKRPIDWLCYDEELVEWLVAHGASINHGEDEYLGRLEARPPLLLETCAKIGSLKTFKFLQSHGAMLSRRTLHMVVSRAAEAGLDPENPGSVQEQYDGTDEKEAHRARWMKDRGEIMRYLVDDLHVDVNGIDTDEEKGVMHYGTPLCYAVRETEGAAVVRWLLKKGADPNIPGAGGERRAKDYATRHSKEISDLLEAWKPSTPVERKAALI